MNNYYGYPEFSYPINGNYQMTPNTIQNQAHRQFRQEHTDLPITLPGTIREDLNDGLTRYTWLNAKQIDAGDFLDFRLIAPNNERAISGGFSINPLVDVHAVTIAPNPNFPFVMVVQLHNASLTNNVLLDFWLITKK
ncbi:hypothetical protein M3644_22080 [Bacillus cereus]|uniref:hypothetical protein n=1 Tax=Bacillus cereus TaxID=1396 RepID=UPI00203C4F45|nr:hypothetical protein [Bacillus cereus]MCM3222462.1 hypothetical protein [Bacillus cereus]